MSKLGQRLITAAKEAQAIARGEADPKTYRVHVPEKVDVRAIRKSLKLSQGKFGKTYHIPAPTLQAWEQNRREPDTTTRAYLTVIQRAPDLVAAALKKTKPSHSASPRAAAKHVARKQLGPAATARTR